jgi:prepilin-type N-terminal cleavage/methylation domain-containing protein
MALPDPSASRSRGFTLVEVMIAATLSVFILAGVLAANLQIVRSGVRMAQYAEIDTQVRRALDTLSHDLKAASAITWNGTSDITLTIPTSGGGTAQVTYAWTAASSTFFRVAGASSAVLTGRLELIRGITTLPDGSAGLAFARFDRDGAVATTDAATKSVQVILTVTRSARTAAAASQKAVSATFTLRSKA